MIIDYLLAKQGLRVEQVDVSVIGIRLAKGGRGGKGSKGLVPQSADEIKGALRLTLADLSAAVARPEIIDQVLNGIPGIARPEIRFANGEDGGIRIIGSVEAMGKRIPITATTKVTVTNNRLILSATRLEGLPIVNSLPLQALDLELPVNMPLGLIFTGVTTEPGCLLLGFEGHNVSFVADQPAVEAPEGDAP